MAMNNSMIEANMSEEDENILKKNISPGLQSLSIGQGGLSNTLTNMVSGLSAAGNILGKTQKGLLSDAGVTPIHKKKIPGILGGRGR